VEEAAAAGVKKAGIVGAALGDFDDVVALAEGLLERGFLVSASSLGLASPHTPALLRALGASGQRSVALAPEAATAGMRARLGKPLAEGRLEECLDVAAAAGLARVKLYYIVGAPGETEADAAAIGDQLASLRKRFRTITFEARVNPLVPKPGTPLAEAPLLPAPAYRRRLRAIKAKAAGVKVVGGSWREAEVQAEMGRGDRATARRVARAAERPGRD
jgi:radical SAM superfamily enzyme YgiQ (UPF0313 family)